MNTGSKNQACDSCRLLKVKCHPAATGSTTQAQNRCRRCQSSGRDCVYSERRRTKRKRTDVRVKELEQQVTALTQGMKTRNIAKAHPYLDEAGSSDFVDASLIARTHPRPGTSQPSRSYCTVPSPTDMEEVTGMSRTYDPVATGLVSMEYAERLFKRYMSDLAPLRPFVVFPSSTSARNLQSSRPVLFLAILAAAAGTLDGSLSTKLNEMIESLLAERVMIRGEKSLELTQAILITMNWYYVPDDYGVLKFNQFSTIVAAMAVELGLDQVDETQLQTMKTEEILEGYRALLGCYICCSSISLKFHRPNMFLFTPEMAECLKLLEASPDSAPTDLTIVAWVRLQNTVDLSELSVDLRNGTSKVDLASEGDWQKLQSCAKQLISWRRNTPDKALNEPLLIQYHSLFSFIHETGLYAEYNLDDFKPPYSIGIANMCKSTGIKLELSPAHLSAIQACISAAHSLINVFIQMPVSTLRCSPVPVYARTSYAVFILVKISISIIHDTGALSGILQPEATNVETYIRQVVQKLEEASMLQCRVAAKWTLIIRGMEHWFAQFISIKSEDSNPPNDIEIIEPLKNLRININASLRSEDEPFFGTDHAETAAFTENTLANDPFTELEFPILPYGLASLSDMADRDVDGDADRWNMPTTGREERTDVFQTTNWPELP